MIKKNLLRILGLGVFVIILAGLDLGEIFSVLKGIDWRYFAVAVILLFPSVAIKAYRWNRIKKAQGIAYAFKDSFLMYCVGIYIGTLTPGRLGELVKFFYLRRDKHSVGKSLFSPVFDRLFDVGFLFLFGYIGLLVFITYLKDEIIYVSGFLFLVLVLSTVFVWKKHYFKRIFLKFARVVFPSKMMRSLRSNTSEFLGQFRIMKTRDVVIFFLLTFAAWVFYYLMLFFVARSIGLDAGFLNVSITVTVAALITLIPISISGIGTRDAVLLLLLVPLGFNAEKIIAFSLLILVFSLFATATGFVCWLLKPARLSMKAKQTREA